MLRKDPTNYPLLIIDTQDSYNCFFEATNSSLMIFL